MTGMKARKTNRGDTIVVYWASSEWRWRRLAPNGRIVGASSEGYRSSARCRANAERCCTQPAHWEERR